MASERQIEANRMNALKSTGPKTDEGKARSRGNHYKHGMAGDGVVMPELLRQAYDDRLDLWAAEIRPQTAEGAWALECAVAASIRIEQCGGAFDLMLVEQTGRARLVWDEQRQLEAATLATRLAAHPMVVVHTLRASRQGAELMIGLWSRLGEAIQAKGEWSEQEESIAMDLLAVPTGLRHGRRPIDAPAGGDVYAHRIDLARRQAERLRDLIDTSLEPLDKILRDQAATVPGAIKTKAAALILRYERDAWRHYDRAIRDAKAVGSEVPPAPEVPASKPVSVPKPPAEPPEPAESAEYLLEERQIFDAHNVRIESVATPEERQAIRQESMAALVALHHRHHPS